jgi:catechol 2,3-dioxygenase-like lactoylglutathione lyase family enzyme
MSAIAVGSDELTGSARTGTIDMKLEVVIVPVSDIERAKAFYTKLGWRLDADFANGTDRVIQFTPPGSLCSIHFGTNQTTAAPGSAQNLFLVVSDIRAAHDELASRGIEVSNVFHYAGFNRVDPAARLSGPAPQAGSYQSFLSFRDPDGNGWLIQEVTTRLPGRGLSLDVDTLTELLRETEQRHGKYEPTAPKHHWSAWYAAYIDARTRGRTPDDAATDAGIHTERARQ